MKLVYVTVRLTVTTYSQSATRVSKETASSTGASGTRAFIALLNLVNTPIFHRNKLPRYRPAAQQPARLRHKGDCTNDVYPTGAMSVAAGSEIL